MYEVWQSKNNGNLIIQNERDCVEIETEFVTKFVNELCENEMISEGTKYEELKESCVLLKAENEKLKAEKEPSHVSIVMRSLQEKRKEITERQNKAIKEDNDFDYVYGTNAEKCCIIERINLYEEFLNDLEEIINKNFA